MKEYHLLPPLVLMVASSVFGKPSNYSGEGAALAIPGSGCLRSQRHEFRVARTGEGFRPSIIPKGFGPSIIPNG
jgi:hypothetical protein